MNVHEINVETMDQIFFAIGDADEEWVETRTFRFPYKALMYKKRGTGTESSRNRGGLTNFDTRSVEQNLRRRRV